MTDLKQQIFVAAHPNSYPDKGIEMAKCLSKAYGKQICILGIPSAKEKDVAQYEQIFRQWTNGSDLNFHIIHPTTDFTDFMESTEASMIVFQISGKKPYSNPLQQLQLCRQLRIPYFFVKSGQEIKIDKVLVPINFLIEEREKGPFSSSFGRFFNAEIQLMPAKDYGSKAKENCEAIRSLLDKFSIKYTYIEAKKNSNKVELEAVKKVWETQADLLMISASRDYGLDDIIFGPKELKVIEQAPVPVMLINPRGDLYTLCG